MTELRVACANSRIGSGGRGPTHLPHSLIQVCSNRTQQVDTMLPKWAITTNWNPKHRDSATSRL